MANFKEKIQDLLKNTTSTEVKTICESFLKDTEGKNVSPSDMVAESLFSNLKNYVEDSHVNTLLNERKGYEQSIMDIESKISRDAAKRLMESWDVVRKDKKVSNVGNHKDNTMSMVNENEAAMNNELLSKLSNVSDGAAQNFVKKSKVDSFSVKEAIETVKSGQIMSHPNVKYAIARIESALMENTPEYMLVNDFLSSMNPFKWDASVNKALTSVQESVNARATDLEVLSTIHAIKSTDGKRFFSDLVSRMNEWVYSDNKNVHDLNREIKGYMFNPHVKSLSDKLMLMENVKGTKFNIPVKGTNCSVFNLYSPVTESEAGQVFKAGFNFYLSTEAGIKQLTEAQVNGLPKDYLELCEAFFNPSVKVIDGNVVAYVGKSKFTITSDKRVFINERQIDASTLGSQLMFNTQQTIFRDSSNMANVVMKVYENLDNICEIDYGKSIVSNVFEGVGVYLFKKGGKMYVNKINTGMNENEFMEANALQTVNLVREFLSFDMSESLVDFLEGDHKRKAEMEGSINTTMNNIMVVENELEKIEQLVLEDPAYGDIKEVSEAKTLLENELRKLKSIWSTMNEELNSFENIVEKKKAEEKEEEKEEEESEEHAEEAPVAEPVAEPVKSEEVKDAGLLGAGGEQVAATGIPGNDNLTAKAEPSTEDVTAVGFAGAEGTQHNPAATKASTEITKEVPAEPVLTPGGEAAVIVAVVPTDVQVSATPETAKAPDDKVEALAAEVAAKVDEVPAEEETEETEVATTESVVSESIGIDSKVKDGVSGKVGKVTAINDEMFTILLDDGETVERKLSDLENIKEIVDQTIEDNSKAAAVAKGEVVESKKEDKEETEEPKETEKEEPKFVTAALTIDLGPFKAGDSVEIDAAGYTSVGDDEPVKLKDEKEGVTEIPKKYLKVSDEKAPEVEVDPKAEAIQKLKELLKGEELEKLKELEALLAGDKKEEEEEEEKEEPKEEEEK